jgi:hypothetical protein
MLHFDLIICKKAFDEIICIAHFTNEYTSYNWVFLLIDHKERTLFLTFKSLINRYDQAELTINLMIKIIRSDQNISIDNALNDQIVTQSIVWKWSTKYILEQNEISKRHDASFIEKVRCIKVHFKLSEELYLKCYSAAKHLLNRTSIRTLNLDLFLIKLKRSIDEKKSNDLIQSESELAHFWVFDCKTYVLIKNSNASAKSAKLKERAFVEFL